MGDWPEHSAELARKSLDHLNDQVFANSQKAISDVALWLVADSICTVTQGLIPAEDWDVIYAVREDTKRRIDARKK